MAWVKWGISRWVFGGGKQPKCGKEECWLDSILCQVHSNAERGDFGEFGDEEIETQGCMRSSHNSEFRPAPWINLQRLEVIRIWLQVECSHLSGFGNQVAGWGLHCISDSNPGGGQDQTKFKLGQTPRVDWTGGTLWRALKAPWRAVTDAHSATTT